MELAKNVLEDYGYKVLTATNGNDALKILDDESNHINMLFTDVIMPGGINGISVANHAMKMKFRPRILITTGWSSHNGDGPNAERLGFPVLSKPYMPDNLIRKIREVMDGPTGI